MEAGKTSRVKTGGVGRLRVGARAQWPFVLLDAATGAPLQEGMTGTSLLVRPGLYDLRVSPPDLPAVLERGLRIREAEETRVDVAGFGRLRVNAVHGWIYRVYRGEQEVVSRECNWDVVLPVGTYTVKVMPEPYPEVTLENIRVLDNETTYEKLTGFGRLRVNASDRGLEFVVYAQDGRCLGRCAAGWDMLLPVGIYRVKIGDATLDNVTVEESGHTIRDSGI